MQEDDNEINSTFKKPTIIDSRAGLRGRLRNEAQNRENKMLDTGLTLIREMGRLAQKNV